MSEHLDPDDFDAGYKVRMIQAYPIIAGMDADELYWSEGHEREDAFERILANRHLRRTHEMYLEDAE